jgi:hypothetical protein
MTRRATLLLSIPLFAGCSSPQKRFAHMAGEFVYTTLSFSPVTATAAGLHDYEGRKLDEQLDDGVAGLEERARQAQGGPRRRLFAGRISR